MRVTIGSSAHRRWFPERAWHPGAATLQRELSRQSPAPAAWLRVRICRTARCCVLDSIKEAKAEIGAGFSRLFNRCPDEVLANNSETAIARVRECFFRRWSRFTSLTSCNWSPRVALSRSPALPIWHLMSSRTAQHAAASWYSLITQLFWSGSHQRVICVCFHACHSCWCVEFVVPYAVTMCLRNLHWHRIDCKGVHLLKSESLVSVRLPSSPEGGPKANKNISKVAAEASSHI